ncbi:LysR family transcriptional regulator [Paracoccaceae bacterium GXU_MW_L88]
MESNNISLTDFKIVVALQETGSFRAAADTLGLSPSALSRHVAGLESRLNTRLFDRDTRNVAPTAQGDVFANISRRMINEAQDALREFDAYMSARSGRLTIAGLPSVTAGFLPDILKAFVAKYPDIDLQIIDALSGSVLDAVESGIADVGFTAGTVTTRERLDFQPIMNDAFVAVGLADGPLQEDRAFKWSELVGMPFIAMAGGTSVRELLNGACLRIGAQLNPRFEVSHLATAGALVSAGLGITALPTLTLPVLQMESLVTRDIVDFGATRRIGLVRRAGRALSPAAAAFCDLVKQARR